MITFFFFKKENETLEKCPICDKQRYKAKNDNPSKIPQKALRYFSSKPILQRLFMFRHTSVDMICHDDKQVTIDGVLKHPPDDKA